VHRAAFYSALAVCLLLAVAVIWQSRDILTDSNNGDPTMTLSDADLDSIADRLALRLHGNCLCGLNVTAQKEMTHLWGMFKDEADGDYARGVELLRGVIKARKAAEKWSDYLGKAMVLFLMTSAAGGVLWLIVEAAKAYIKSKIKTGG